MNLLLHSNIYNIGMIPRNIIRYLSTETLKVVNDLNNKRFTVTLNNQLAALDYETYNSKIAFTRMDIPTMFYGKGVASLLAKHAFEFAADNDLHVICKSEILKKYYESNIHKYSTLKVDFEEE